MAGDIEGGGAINGPANFPGATGNGKTGPGKGNPLFKGAAPFVGASGSRTGPAAGNPVQQPGGGMFGQVSSMGAGLSRYAMPDPSGAQMMGVPRMSYSPNRYEPKGALGAMPSAPVVAPPGVLGAPMPGMGMTQPIDPRPGMGGAPLDPRMIGLILPPGFGGDGY